MEDFTKQARLPLSEEHLPLFAMPHRSSCLPTHHTPTTQASFSRRIQTVLALAAVSLLCACSTTPPKEEIKTATFELSNYDEINVASLEDWSKALSAFQQSCTKLTASPWNQLCQDARNTLSNDEYAAKLFFEIRFQPWRVSAIGERDIQDTGLMTGYYEPLLHGSRQKGGPYQTPIYGVPDDLLIIDLGALYPDLKGRRLRGKLDGRRVIPYDDRRAIDQRTDMERWAIAWVDDPVDAFFLQIQGSGRIALPDGTFMRVGFADQNGWKYQAIGSWLVKNEGLSWHELSMQRIRAWAKANPNKVENALAQNPSFVFFAERSGDPAFGPIGAQGVPLTPGGSVAVDPREWRLGTPFIVEAEQTQPALHFARPVIAQDTGGAIRGLIRFDYFWGFGDEAGRQAGRQKSSARAWVLVPVGLRPEDIRPGGKAMPR